MEPATLTSPSKRGLSSKPLRFLALSSLLVTLLIAPLYHLHVINRNMPPAKADLVPVWMGTRVALHHGDPYSAQTTRQIQLAYYGRLVHPGDGVNPMGFAYPAYTVILFAPLAPFSWPVVRLISLFLLPLLTAISLLLWLRVTGIRLSPGSVVLALVLTLASWPVVWGVHQIQPTLIVAALVAAGCFLLQRGNPTAAGIIFALATIKPQLVGPLLAWLCLWTLLRREWRFLASLTLSLAALLGSATWLLPGWVPHWRIAMAQYVVYRHLVPDLNVIFGHWGGLAAAVLLASAAVITLWRGRRCAPDSPAFGAFCALALATTVCLIPNEIGMVYNHVLLLPACLILLFTEPVSSLTDSTRRFANAVLVIDFLIVPVAALGETLTRPSDFWDSLPCKDLLLPTLLTLFLLFTLAPARRSSVAAELDLQTAAV
jgi:hypothetical protein